MKEKKIEIERMGENNKNCCFPLYIFPNLCLLYSSGDHLFSLFFLFWSNVIGSARFVIQIQKKGTGNGIILFLCYSPDFDDVHINYDGCYT